jgi:hypothetical protein
MSNFVEFPPRTQNDALEPQFVCWENPGSRAKRDLEYVAVGSLSKRSALRGRCDKEHCTLTCLSLLKLGPQVAHRAFLPLRPSRFKSKRGHVNTTTFHELPDPTCRN